MSRSFVGASLLGLVLSFFAPDMARASQPTTLDASVSSLVGGKHEGGDGRKKHGKKKHGKKKHGKKHGKRKHGSRRHGGRRRHRGR